MKRLLPLLGALAFLVLTSCSGDASDDAANPPNGTQDNIDQLDIGPVTTTSDAPVADVLDEPDQEVVEEPEATVLNNQKLGRVFIATNGNDGNTGAAPDQARRTVGAALAVLEPGGTIVFQPGTYPPLRLVGLSGSSGAPVRLEAAGSVEFRDDDYRSGAGILIRDSRHVEVIGMRVRHALWGVYIDGAHNITVRSVDVGDIGQEGIRVKGGSTNVRLDGNLVADTGRRTDQGRANGEGIYIGTGSPGGVDHVSNITVVNNRIVRTTDEAIDIKRPATNVNVIGNTISDVVTHTSGAIVVHLNGDQSGNPNINVERNVVRNITRSSPHRDGNCIVSQVHIRIVNNVLHDCQHRGIYLRGSGGTATVMHNTLINPGDVGDIVSDGRGMQVVSKNNLGAGGNDNRRVGSDVYVDANGGNYRLTDSAAADLASAPNVGVTNDLRGASRPEGNVTFGAVEASSASNIAPTTTAPRQPAASTPTTVEPSAAAPATQQPSTPSATQPSSGDAAPSSSENSTEPSTPAAPATNAAAAASEPTDGAQTVNNSATGRLALPTEAVSCFETTICAWAPFL